VPVIASANGGFAETVEPKISGLLFPNGDATALLGCLRAVASGSAFPGRSIPIEVAARTARERDLGLHVSRLCAVFSSVICAEPGALDKQAQ
jgi:glycosyltransferase involved in cell wall biosynthesis